MFPYSYCGKVYLEWKAFYYSFMTVNCQLGMSLCSGEKLEITYIPLEIKDNVAMFFAIYSSVVISGSSYAIL